MFGVSGMKISPNCLLGERVGEVACLIRQRKNRCQEIGASESQVVTVS